MNNFLVQSLDRVLDYFLTVYCSGRLLSSQEEGKKAVQILACCRQPPELCTFKHQASGKKKNKKYNI